MGNSFWYVCNSHDCDGAVITRPVAVTSAR